jgi:hypothetical protein
VNYQTLVPAYGRDYKSQKEVLADWNTGKDFRMEPQGCYCSKRDFEKEKGTVTVNIRYAKLTKVLPIKV